MEDEPESKISGPPSDEPDEKPPRTLEDYLSAKCPPAIYFKELSKNRAPLPDDESRRRALEVVLQEARALTRAVELAKAGADERVDGRTRRAIIIFGSEIVRASGTELSEWGTRGGVSTDTEVGLLARRLRKARASKEKEAIALAEAALLIGLSVCSARADFDIIGALAAVAANLNEPKLHPHEAAKHVQRTLRRSSVKAVENFALVNTIVAARLEDSSQQLSQSVAQNQLLRDQVRSLQDKVSSQQERIAQLEVDFSAVSAELSKAHGHIAGVKGGAAHEMIEMKARSRQFLARSVKPALRDADEALDIDPPFVDVARERIKAVSSDVEKELAWLNQSSE
jgi:hypothetical protein